VGAEAKSFLRSGPLALGIVTLCGVVVLLVQDAGPPWFPARSHEFLSAFSLAMIAIAYVAFQMMRKAPWKELLKAGLLAAAFFFWAANQFWPGLPQAGLFNDIAIALFVLDVFLVIAGWPPAAKGELSAGSNEQRFDALVEDLHSMAAGGNSTRDEVNQQQRG
jgi:hypothetical protein